MKKVYFYLVFFLMMSVLMNVLIDLLDYKNQKKLWDR